MRAFRLAFLLATTAVTAAAFAAEPSAHESALGDQIYRAMVARGEILRGGPEAAALAPVVRRLATAETPDGAHFNFYVDRASDINAFVVYGPRVYVDRGLIRFADSQEELAGVLCHEMSHVISGDAFADDRLRDVYDGRVEALVKQVDTKLHRGTPLVENGASIAENLLWLRHSRNQETLADMHGAALCARQGLSPWGLVWTLRKILATTRDSRFAFFSDHPSLRSRIRNLQHYIGAHKALFSGWRDAPRSGIPLR